jgi:hypothetical protein
MDTLRLIPRTGTEEILLAVLRELESIHADLERLVGVGAPPQPEEAPVAKAAAPAKKPAAKRSTARKKP